MKGKVKTRNNLLHKLANSSWDANTFTLRATTLALCYSVAEYACPVWERSSHAKKVDASLNDSCRCITGCLRPTNVDSLYVLAGNRSTWRSQISSQQDWTQEASWRHSPSLSQPPTIPKPPEIKEELPSCSPATVTASSNSKASIVGGTTICKATPSKAANPN